ncbi:MAG TPA: C40 family peptidase [Actinoplanes sp.]|nr:C40 family peptidase [Actinoplanes sp.]
MRRPLAGTVLLLAVTASGAAAQGVQAHVGRFYEGEGWTLYRLGMDRPLIGPLATTVHGDYLRRVGDADGAFAGLGLDVTAFRGGGPYLVAGIGAGMGSPHSQSFSSIWGSWSAGGGYELVPASFLRVGLEGRWREISLDHRDGLELSAGISLNIAGGRRTPSRTDQPDPDAPTPIAPPASAVAAPGAPAATPVTASSRLADSVIATATEVMGRPYKYGGTGQNGGGFDCSGLIQYAYAQHGITLPRRSVDQAREGSKVRKDVAALLPGDLLTFSNRGGAVTHVGLYIGGRRFIHSATRGVQVSILSADDPYGRWWHKRWVGVRRIVP